MSGVKYHFPLICPLSDFLQVFREEAVGGVHVGNADEERGVIGEEFNLRRNIISEVVYIDEEGEINFKKTEGNLSRI